MVHSSLVLPVVASVHNRKELAFWRGPVQTGRMNLQIHHVISDITGVTGLAIVDAIVAGETNPEELAKLRNHRIKASLETVRKSLVGDYRPEHIFTLKQSLTAYRYYQQLIADCDREIQERIERFKKHADPSATAEA